MITKRPLHQPDQERMANTMEHRIPHLRKQNGMTQLIVKDKPFILLAGEAGNSNSSSVSYMEGVWKKAESLGMNTLLLPVTWELLEPQEGVFDFSLVDGLITQARRYNGHLVFLWFGAWKNAQCYYAPEWVKTDTERFRRAEVEKGKKFIRNEAFYGMPYTTLSYLCEATKNADAKAFRTLMAHIREVDGSAHTVVAVQVENETGLMGAAREHSDEADALYAAPVPQDFAAYMKAHTESMAPEIKAAVEAGASSGSWAEVFGSAAEELFSAYYVAGYVGYVAAAGKAAYPLPMVANCWLDKGEEAGKYPTGGPVSKYAEVWRFCAPDIDIHAPDIYVQNFLEVCDEYTRRKEPLFIPETATHGHAAPREVYCIGHYHAICYSPFGFEEMGGEAFGASMAFLFGVDTTDPMLSVPQKPEEYGYVTKALREMMPKLTAAYGTSGLQAVIAEKPENDTMIFGCYGFKAVMNSPMSSRKDGYCLVLQETDDSFYILVNGAMLVPFSTDPDRPYLDILSLEDGCFHQGQWHPDRRLNGDQVAIMNYETPTLLRIKLFAYG